MEMRFGVLWRSGGEGTGSLGTKLRMEEKEEGKDVAVGLWA